MPGVFPDYPTPVIRNNGDEVFDCALSVRCFRQHG
jgi:hypothetical protein